MRLEPDGLVVTREHAKGDVAARGTASDLLLLVWGRITPDAVDVFGDAGAARRSCASELGARSDRLRRDGVAEHVDDVLAAGGERVGRERIDVEQTGHQRRVREVRQHRAVAR